MFWFWPCPKKFTSNGVLLASCPDAPQAAAMMTESRYAVIVVDSATALYRSGLVSATLHTV